MTKQEARNTYRDLRRQLSAADRNRYDDLLLIGFQQIPLPALTYIHTYLAIKEEQEIETDHMLHYLEFGNPGLSIVIPRLKEDELEHVRYDEMVELHPNKWGIPEPVNGELVDEAVIDLVLVPLLAFDEKGYRVGYGKGYYDKFLSKCRPDVLKIGFSYFSPLQRITDTAEFDIPLNYCVTPQGVYEFG
jgi:5-formyltetrahydrofolate cyclo-ligase